MDQPDLDRCEHQHALAGLRRLNFASGVCRQLWHVMRAFARRHGRRRLRVLDVASGGGDVCLGLWNLARRQGFDLEILGLDISPIACDYASRRSEVAGSAISFQPADVTREALPTGFDVVTCTLFLHHLASDEASKLLTTMAGAGKLLLVSDLRRCALGYALSRLACHVLTTSPVVQFDGPQSVENAFTLEEMRSLCATAGLPDSMVRPVWPCRLTIIREQS
jgi:2-polyprenyl-3-methyl-5-hydroxy-6-metoxy-1,4-benzoquinol methylase